MVLAWEVGHVTFSCTLTPRPRALSHTGSGKFANLKVVFFGRTGVTWPLIQTPRRDRAHSPSCSRGKLSGDIMRENPLTKRVATLALALSVWALPLVAFSQ